MSVLLAPQQARRNDPAADLIFPRLSQSTSLRRRPTDTVAGTSSEPPHTAGYANSKRHSTLETVCRSVVQRRFQQLGPEQVDLLDGSQARRMAKAAIHVHDPAFYRRATLGGSLGAAESYIQGEWSADNLLEVLRTLAKQMHVVRRVDRGCPRFLSPFRAAWNGLRRNNRNGSRRNIAAHYDLSNEFFSLMLDPTMTYSAGIFERPTDSMEQATLAKYERICRKLNLAPSDHLLEIGTGWGGFAIHAAKTVGCRVTTTTISQRQYAFARQRIEAEGLTDRITLLREDYRDLDGTFDKLVSIEMIEAVGERFLDSYFSQCSRLLTADGMMLLQAITIPDHRYDYYRRSVDFIQRYIFPGGFLPSFSAIATSLRRRTRFSMLHSEDFGDDYGETLARWRSKFWSNIEKVRALGFDERFIRMWHYYLCYCEAGFRERHIGVSQLLLAKPECRRERVQ